MAITTAPSAFYGHQNITRKVLLGFLDFLNGRIFVERFDDTGAIYRYIKVPLHSSSRERFFHIVKSSTVVNNSTSNEIELNNILPRIAVNISGMTYDSTRKVPKHNKIKGSAGVVGDGSVRSVMAPVPYKLDLELSILTKTIDDNFQIIEQIVPYFAPSFSMDIQLLSDFDPLSVQYTLISVTPDSTDEYAITDERLFLSTMSFTVNVMYYYNRASVGTIKEMIANFHIGKEGSEDYKKIKKYELVAQNISPITSIENRGDEPMTLSQTEY